MKLEIAFIGSGNVAWHLAKAMDKAGHTIAQVISKHEENAKALAVKFGAHFSNDLSMLYGNVDVCFICVPDDEIQNVVNDLPAIKSILVHTCGPKPMDILNGKAARYGVFYPLQSFSKHWEVDMLKVPVLIESSGNETYEKLFALADSISNFVRDVNSNDRLKYHLSAVLANNFTNHLFYEAERYLTENNLDFKVLHPIIQETSAKILRMMPNEAQTGPAKRGDQETIEKHLQLLEGNIDLQQVYRLLSKGIENQ